MPSNDAALEDKSLDIIPSVLNGSPFKIRPDNEKLSILQQGRPQPKLNIVKRDSTRNCNRTFQTSWYGIHKWLCGSTSYNKLFCWPCTLMRPETSSWCSTGNDDMKRFTSLATKHALCKSHVKAISEYDETLSGFGMQPEFAQELNFKCKEEDQFSDHTDQDEGINVKFKEEAKTKKSLVQALSSDLTSNTSDVVEMSDRMDSPKVRTKITFKTWQEMNKDTFPVASSKLFEDAKIYKWKRKIAKQELKNARLIGEKLKYEIEVLKAKADYYRNMKDDSSKEDETSQQSCMMISIQPGQQCL